MNKFIRRFKLKFNIFVLFSSLLSIFLHPNFIGMLLVKPVYSGYLSDKYVVFNKILNGKPLPIIGYILRLFESNTILFSDGSIVAYF